ncbi:DUF6475 domain-containing protein [Achromobacter spanius]|uniref:DUF6475 domain-containing protein n=1 Tax=Achromobacter spanius TaxID=217203 RepID=UPI0037F3D387
MPKPVDVVELLPKPSQDGALVTWAKVDRGVRQVGTHSTVVFDHPIIHPIVQDMGGWFALGVRQEKEWPIVAKLPSQQPHFEPSGRHTFRKQREPPLRADHQTGSGTILAGLLRPEEMRP